MVTWRGNLYLAIAGHANGSDDIKLLRPIRCRRQSNGVWSLSAKARSRFGALQNDPMQAILVAAISPAEIWSRICDRLSAASRHSEQLKYSPLRCMQGKRCFKVRFLMMSRSASLMVLITDGVLIRVGHGAGAKPVTAVPRTLRAGA